MKEENKVEFSASTDDFEDEIPALRVVFLKYPKAHWVNEIEFKDSFFGKIMTQVDDDKNLGNLLISDPLEFLKVHDYDYMVFNGYNLIDLIKTGMKEILKDKEELDYYRHWEQTKKYYYIKKVTTKPYTGELLQVS